jgi:vacuolar-type H+-ATPase subunit E/Vma4
LKTTTSALTEAQKEQALLNAVLQAGAAVTGAYEAAMDTANKQIRSTPRLLKEIQRELGDTMQPIFGGAVFALNNFLSAVQNTLSKNNALTSALHQIGDAVGRPLQNLAEFFGRFSKSGFDISFLTKPIQALKDGLTAIGPLGASLASGGIVSFLSQFQVIGRFLGPLTGLNTALVTLVVTNKDLRKGFMDLLGALGQAAGTISQALIPVWNAVNDAFKKMGPDLKTILDQFAALVVQIAQLASSFITAALPAIRTALGVFGELVHFLAESKLGAAALVTALGAFATIRIVDSIGQVTKKFGEMNEGMNKSRLLAAGLGLAGAAAIGTLSSSIPNKAVQQGGAAVSAGLTAGITVGAATGNPLIGAGVGLGVAGLTLIGQHMADNANKTKEATKAMEDYIRSQIAIKGVVPAFEEQRNKLAGIKDELKTLKEYQKEMSAAAATGDAYAVHDVIDRFGGMKSKDVNKRVKELESDRKSTEDALKTSAKNQTDTFQQWAAGYVAAQDKANSAMNQSALTLKKMLGVNAGDIVDWAHLTTSQMDLVIQKSQQFIDATSGWVDNYLSLGTVLGTETQKDFDRVGKLYENAASQAQDFYNKLATLKKEGASQAQIDQAMAQAPKDVAESFKEIGNTLYSSLLPRIAKSYDELYNRTGHFMNDLKTLLNAGLDSNQVLDLLKQGPGQVGDAVAAMVQQYEQMGPQLGDQLITQIKEAYGKAKDTAVSEARELAKIALQTSGATKVDSGPARDASIAELTKQRDAMVTAQKQIQAGMQGIMEGATQGKAFDAAKAYNDQMQALLKAVADPNSTTQQVASMMAKAMNLGEALQREDPDAKSTVEWLNQVLQVLASQKEAFANTANSLGLSTTEAYAAGMQNGIPDIVATLQQIDQILAAHAPGKNVGADYLSPDAAEGLLGQQSALKQAKSNLTQAPLTPAQAANKFGARPTPGPGGGTPANISTALPVVNTSPSVGGGGGKSARDIAADIEAQTDKLDLWTKAVDQAVQSLQRLRDIEDQTTQNSYDLAKSIGEMAAQGADTTRGLASVRSMVKGLTDALVQETQEMVRNGQVAKTAEAMTGQLAARVGQLSQQLPQMIHDWLEVDQSIEAVTARIGRFNTALDRTLNLQMSAKRSTLDSQDAYDKLSETYNDNQALLTNAQLSPKDKRQLEAGQQRALMDYVDSIEKEATQLAKAGKIGNDYASIQKFIKDKLKEVQDTLPGLKGDVQDYQLQLEQIKPEYDSQIKVYTEEATAQLKTFEENTRLYVPKTMTTILQVQIDQATLAAARTTLEGLKTDTQSMTDGANLAKQQADSQRYSEAVALATARFNENYTDYIQRVIHESGGLTPVEGIEGSAKAYAQQFYDQVMHNYGYDVGGTLPPGVFKVMNNTGKNEFVLTPEQFNAMIGLGGQGSGYPPAEWMQEALWHLSNGFNPPVGS